MRSQSHRPPPSRRAAWRERRPLFRF
jgi:hypothetical protein